MVSQEWSLAAWGNITAHWIPQVFVLLCTALFFDFLQRRLVLRIHRKLETHTKTPWDDALVEAVRGPLSLLIWVLAISISADIAGKQAQVEIFRLVPALRSLGVVIALTWFLMKAVHNFELAYVRGKREGSPALDAATIHSIGRLLRISIFITASLVALQNMGFSISGLLAFGGVGGLALSLAAKDTLANFFGALMIFLDRPFAVGDWVRSPDKEIEGVVEHISWRLTRIRTFDKRPLYVPNSIFSSIAVENPSRMSHRRIYETIGLRYADAEKVGALVAAVREMLTGHPEIDAKQTLIVNFNSFAPSSLDFFIYTFTRTTSWVRYHEIKQDVLLKISEIIHAHGAEIAFPTSTLHVEHKPAPEPEEEQKDLDPSTAP